MRGTGGVLVVAVATVLVCCSADPHQDSEVSEGNAERFESSGQKHRTLERVSNGLVRDARDTGNMLLPYFLARQNYYGSGLNKFLNKRNIDEIDQTSMPFPYATKRFYHLYGPNHSPLSSFDKKRYRADYPMDEIDLSHFPIGSKRSHDVWPLR